MDFGAKVVLVTGASTGLGLALSRRLVQTEHRVILTARSQSLARFKEQGLQESPRVWVRPMDVTDGSQRRRVIEEASERWSGVDVLINNAGIAYRSVVEHLKDHERLEQMDINFNAPMELVRLVLPGMRQKKAGRILNISSVGGMMAMPTMAMYSASKFALEGATEALWYEVRPWNIRVSLIQPGFINSESFMKTRRTSSSQRSETSELDPYHNHYRFMQPFIARMMRLAFATPEDVANTILKTMERRRPPLRVPATLDAHFFALLRRLLPRNVYHRVLYYALPNVRKWGPF
ncbi:MAG: SDR family oxidoreductase [Myxococcales bacterium]|nr:SDR family oxidoreductase [Myxococcales bacterium]